MCKSWCQPFDLGTHHYIIDFKGHGSWVEFLAASCFVFVCLFVCFSAPKVGDYFVFISHKWVRFSCFFVFLLLLLLLLFFFFWFLLLLVLLLLLFFLQNVQFPHHISRVRVFFFACLFVCFLFRRLVKSFAFFYFCLFVFILFCFVLFCFCFCFQKIPPPLDIKWCALILILLQRWWWTLRHRQFWIPVQFSEKSNSNLKLH